MWWRKRADGEGAGLPALGKRTVSAMVGWYGEGGLNRIGLAPTAGLRFTDGAVRPHILRQESVTRIIEDLHTALCEHRLKPIDGRSVGLLRHKHEDMGVFVFVVSEK